MTEGESHPGNPVPLKAEPACLAPKSPGTRTSQEVVRRARETRPDPDRTTWHRGPCATPGSTSLRPRNTGRSLGAHRLLSLQRPFTGTGRSAPRASPPRHRAPLPRPRHTGGTPNPVLRLDPARLGARRPFQGPDTKHTAGQAAAVTCTDQQARRLGREVTDGRGRPRSLPGLQVASRPRGLLLKDPAALN